jgi:hypothetical protein
MIPNFEENRKPPKVPKSAIDAHKKKPKKQGKKPKKCKKALDKKLAL